MPKKKKCKHNNNTNYFIIRKHNHPLKSISLINSNKAQIKRYIPEASIQLSVRIM